MNCYTCSTNGVDAPGNININIQCGYLDAFILKVRYYQSIARGLGAGGEVETIMFLCLFYISFDPPDTVYNDVWWEGDVW